MVVAAGGVSDAGAKEGLRRMQNTPVSATTWPNRKQPQETAQREETTGGESGEYKTNVCHRLSPLKQHYKRRWYQRTASSATASNKGKGLSGSSPSDPVTSTLRGSSSASVSKSKEGHLYASQPLVPSTETGYVRGLPQTEDAQPSSTQQSHSDVSISKFVPLKGISTTRRAGAAANSANSANSARCGAEGAEGKKDEERSPFGQVITNDLLREWIGEEELSLVISAEFRLNTKFFTGVETIGDRMPRLQSLKLNNSYIPQIRLLGTKLVNLKRLWIASSQLETLSGIGTCAPLLEELYAPFNTVHDVTPLLDLSETLEVVDLEGNDIRDVSSLIHSLPLLRNVKYLTLQGNPVAVDPSTSTSSASAEESAFTTRSFRDAVQSLMPELKYLDDVVVTRAADPAYKEALSDSKGTRKTGRTLACVDPRDVTLSGEYMFLQQCIRECGFDELEAAVVEATRGVYSRPQTSCGEARPRCSASAGSQGSQRPRSSSHTVQRLLAAPNCGRASAGRWPLAAGGASQITPSPPAASLRNDRALVSGSIRLRSRLPPLQTATGANSRVASGNSCGRQSGASAGSSRSGGDNSSGPNVSSSPSTAAEVSAKGARKEADGRCSGRNSDASPLLLAAVEESIDTPLFDEADEEWEVYKKNLLRRMDTRRAAIQRWSKYMSSESGVSSHGEHDSAGLSAFSHSTSTQTTSVSSGPGLLQLPQREQATAVSGAAEVCGAITTSHIPDRQVNAAEEDAWREELVRSVARSRTRTARAASDKECRRVGGDFALEDGEPATVTVAEGSDKTLYIE
ncbi:putative leucine-rich repeat protein (LRRP) [Trypanosoma conorhini]|uniref:Putative leucine-rich repeat protein (LRRP) n=1 Tax=Trypanosoma conorhini TaxID=83891 RepID=A0A3R7LE05_9TRYP|nr:putative leucine-rich repeat protein (LRRP) [Trypanosoma conorhini]RNF25352.1 putative leucine-rich repeat protein (LRRP) [Trypanosoma conorhini]